MRLEPPGHDGVHGLVVWCETALDGKLRPDAPDEVARCSGLGDCAGQRQITALPTIVRSAAKCPLNAYTPASVAGNTLSAAAMPTQRPCAGTPDRADHDHQQQEVRDLPMLKRVVDRGRKNTAAHTHPYMRPGR